MYYFTSYEANSRFWNYRGIQLWKAESEKKKVFPFHQGRQMFARSQWLDYIYLRKRKGSTAHWPFNLLYMSRKINIYSLQAQDAVILLLKSMGRVPTTIDYHSQISWSLLHTRLQTGVQLTSSPGHQNLPSAGISWVCQLLRAHETQLGIL